MLGGVPFLARSAYGAEQARSGRALNGASAVLAGVELVIPDLLAPQCVDLTGVEQPFAAQATRIFQSLLDANTIAPEMLDDNNAAAVADRWGRRLVDPVLADGRRISEVLVADGAARVHPQTERLDHLAKLLNAENDAREKMIGLWSHDFYHVRSATPADVSVGRYHIVKGDIVSAGRGRNRIFFNFGEDFRTDVTATARSSIFRRWKLRAPVDGLNDDPGNANDGSDINAFAGATCRVRGWVQWINGPSIDLAHIRQIEWL